MILAIVGSTDLTLHQRQTAKRVIRGIIGLYVGVRVISGGAAGVDDIAESVACDEGCFMQSVRPKNQRWEPEGFKDRNMVIAHMCDVLWSIRSEQSKTYGSGWTADYAQEIGKEVHRLKLP